MAAIGWINLGTYKQNMQSNIEKYKHKKHQPTVSTNYYIKA